MATEQSPLGHLFGASDRHVQVVVVTITDKEFPIACEVFSRVGQVKEVGGLQIYSSAQFHAQQTLPFVLVQATDRGNLVSSLDVTEWIRLFRPQIFLVVGTAGGIWRPVDHDRAEWSGRPLGDVVLSEFIHYTDYRKVQVGGDLIRHHRLEQPSSHLIKQARGVKNDPLAWHQWLSSRWDGAGRLPQVTEHEMVVGEQIQDNPLAETQQFLMQHFDRAGAVEMESAGVGQALHYIRRDPTYAPLYLSVRGISDLIWATDGQRPLDDKDLDRARRHYSNLHRESDSVVAADKTFERDLWSPRAAEAASAFALALVRRLVAEPMPTMSGHPEIAATTLGPTLPEAGRDPLVVGQG